MCHFIGGQRPKRPADHLLTIRQEENETLRSCVKRFTRETLEVDEADDKVQLTTFKAGLRSRDLVASLTKNPLTHEESSKDDGRDALESTEVHER